MLKYILIFILIDLISKIIVSNFMVIGKSIKIIENFFYLTYVKNNGVAWSLLDGKKLFIIIATIFIIFFLISYVKKHKPKNRLETIGYSLILGGAIGNFLNRLIFGCVVDFLDFYFWGYNFPIFNLADTFICIGVIIYIICSWGDKR